MANVNLIYFSPAMSTKKVVQQIGMATTLNIVDYNITKGLAEELTFGPTDLAIIGVPVYAGRVPAVAAETLKKIKGQQTPAVVVCVYGNRDYDDALLELQHICENNQFEVFAGAAFIARHSIFPTVAEGRPDEKDRLLINEFGQRCASTYLKILRTHQAAKPTVKGNKPYKVPGKIPLKPKASSKCTKCGTCVEQCPVGAIHENNPRKTDKKLCISCSRCIVVFPEKARNFKGLIYRIATKKFASAYSARKEPEVLHAD